MKIAGIALLVCAALLFFRSIDAMLAGGHQRSRVMAAILPVTNPLLGNISDVDEKNRKKEEIVAAASVVVREIDDHLIDFGLYGFGIGAIQTAIGLYLVAKVKSQDENHGA